MNQKTDSQISADVNPWYFFGLALTLSWLFWIPLALLGEDPMRSPYLILMILGGLGPAIAEIILVFGLGTRRQKRDYKHRVLDVRRIGWKWAAVILLMFPVLNAVATLLSVVIGAPQPAFETVGRLLVNVYRSFRTCSSSLFSGRCPRNWAGAAMLWTGCSRSEVL